VRLYVRKRSGKRQPFDRPKLLEALRSAAHKRPVETAELERLVDQIETEVSSTGGELSAHRVGELCLEGLAKLDRGAYLQFAGVFDADAVEPALVAAGAGDGSVRAGGEDAMLPREAG
jgi:transcriptional repressor NrdR